MSAKTIKLASTIALAAVMALSAAGASHAFTMGGATRTVVPKRPASHIVGRRDTIPPFAFAGFCTRQSDQCDKQGHETMVDLTKEKRALLQRINAQVNRDIVYSDDAANGDEWRVNVSSGDCDDYALTKRYQLLAAGWPSGALRIATARTPEGIGHAVLVVSTTKGDLVLDNRTNVVKPWFATQLRLIKIQSPENPRVWQAI